MSLTRPATSSVNRPVPVMNRKSSRRDRLTDAELSQKAALLIKTPLPLAGEGGCAGVL